MYDARKHICFNLGRVMRRVYDYYERRLSPFGLTPPPPPHSTLYSMPYG